MQIKSISNNSFSGIKLSSNDYYKTRDIAKQLEKQGFSCLGHRTFICNNTINDKIKLAKQIRSRAYFYENGFGAIFLPWSQEAYLMSTPQNEQNLYNLIKDIDDGAVLNLAI